MGGRQNRDVAVFFVGVGFVIAVLVVEAALGAFCPVSDEGVGDLGPLRDRWEDSGFELLQLGDVVLHS